MDDDEKQKTEKRGEVKGRREKEEDKATEKQRE